MRIRATFPLLLLFCAAVLNNAAHGQDGGKSIQELIDELGSTEKQVRRDAAYALDPREMGRSWTTA